MGKSTTKFLQTEWNSEAMFLLLGSLQACSHEAFANFNPICNLIIDVSQLIFSAGFRIWFL